MTKAKLVPYKSLDGSGYNAGDLRFQKHAKVVSVSRDHDVVVINYDECDLSDPALDPLVLGVLWVESLGTYIPVALWNNEVWRISGTVFDAVAASLHRKPK